MTNGQFLVIIGVIYIAPHLRPPVALTLGILFLLGAVLNGLKII